MESTTETFSMTKELEIAARPEVVWRYLIDPEKITTWMGQAAVLEPHEGGLYRIDPVPGHVARGEIVSIDPPRRLVFTWGWEPGDGEPPVVPPGSSTIEIELVAEGAGTRVLFTHRDLPTAESAESHTHGWEHYLARLVTAASGGDPGRDPWLDGNME
jgi:uncharacterized protein YndB with AHSA1/START domain